MRVLSVTVGEEIQIGDDVVVKIVKISDTRVQIGITAPLNVPVFRKELLQRDQGIEER